MDWQPISTSTVLAVSPHPDDIALSCGGLIRLTPDMKLTIVNCFDQSLYAPLATPPPRTVSDVRSIRSAEDATYAEAVRARRLSLGLRDVSLRVPDMRDWLQDSPPKDEEYERLIIVLGELITGHLYECILCPLAVGAHVDHKYVHMAVRELALPDQRILFYEDLPYGSRIGGPLLVSTYASQVLASASSLLIDISEVIKAKLLDIAVYKSQIYANDLDHVRAYAKLLGEGVTYQERYWQLAQL